MPNLQQGSVIEGEGVLTATLVHTEMFNEKQNHISPHGIIIIYGSINYVELHLEY